MFCPRCGKEIKNNQRFCINCGYDLSKDVEMNKEKDSSDFYQKKSYYKKINCLYYSWCWYRLFNFKLYKNACFYGNDFVYINVRFDAINCSFAYYDCHELH